MEVNVLNREEIFQKKDNKIEEILDVDIRKERSSFSGRQENKMQILWKRKRDNKAHNKKEM